MAKIDAHDKHINSGFYSGNQHVNMGNLLMGASGVCKGTVRSYCPKSSDKPVTLQDPHNSGAFSGGNKTGDKGTVDDSRATQASEDSKVIGTQRSFNVGSEPSRDESVRKRKVTNYRTWNANDCLCDNTESSYGTCGSFTAIGDNSKIDAVDATINSGYGAGCTKNSFNAQKHKVCGKDVGRCQGTEKSFNAASGEEININGATLNTGAFAGSKAK